VLIALAIGFTVLIWIAFRAYREAPPVPEKIVDSSGQVVFWKNSSA
jgi:nitric oxide reductase subunit B